MSEKRYYKIRKNRQNRSKNLKKAGIATGISLGILLLLYIAVSVYFLFHFFPGTIIRGKDFSWKSSKAVEDYYNELADTYKLKIVDKDQKYEFIEGRQIDLQYSPGKEIRTALTEQKPFLWGYAVFYAGETDIPVTVKYNDEKLKEEISALDIVQQEQTEPVSAVPVYENGKYTVKKEEYGTDLDTDELSREISEYITGFKEQINLSEEECYKKPAYTAQSVEVSNACIKLNNFLNLNITYDLGETVKISSDVIADWLTLDEKMNVTINEDAVRSWVSDLADRYNTVGKTRNITTPGGKMSQVTGGTYGWEIDEEAESSELIRCLKKGEDFSRKPVYKEGKTAASHGGQDWGTTYLEVDLTQQYMWYIENGEVRLEGLRS